MIIKYVEDLVEDGETQNSKLQSSSRTILNIQAEVRKNWTAVLASMVQTNSFFLLSVDVKCVQASTCQIFLF